MSGGSASVGVALVGVGFGLRTLLPALLDVPGVDVVAVCAGHQENAESVARRHGIPFATADVRAAVEHPGVDLAALCLPPTMHTTAITAALDAGRHVFSTKPLTLRLADAEAVCDRARSLGVVTAMEYCFRYLPVRRAVRDLVRDGFVGDLRLVSASVLCDFATRPDHELAWWKWVSSRAEGGGILGASLALHHLDLLRYMFGELHETSATLATAIRSKPVRDAPGTHRPVDSEDTVVVTGRLGGGAPFSLVSSWSVHHPSGDRLEVHGSEGTLVVERSGRLLGARRGDDELRPLPAEVWGDAIVPTPQLYARLVEDLVATIRAADHEPQFATFDDGLRLMEIVNPILVAADDG